MTDPDSWSESALSVSVYTQLSLAPDCQPEGRGLLVVQSVDLGPGLQQQPHNLLAAAADGVVKRSRVSEMLILKMAEKILL